MAKRSRKSNQSKTSRNPKGSGRERRVFTDDEWQAASLFAAAHLSKEQIRIILKTHFQTLERECKKTHGITMDEWIKEQQEVGKATIRMNTWMMMTRIHSWKATEHLCKHLLGETDRSTLSIQHSQETVHFYLPHNQRDDLPGEILTQDELPESASSGADIQTPELPEPESAQNVTSIKKSIG